MHEPPRRCYRASGSAADDPLQVYPGHRGHAPLEGFGAVGERYLLLKKGKPDPSAVHLAFRARSRKAVDAFHAAALAAGARDNGPPGVRLHYFPSYYAAYVLDLDGYNIEAVYQR